MTQFERDEAMMSLSHNNMQLGKAVIVDPDTGEIVPVLPMKPNKTTLTVTFK